MPIVTWLMTRLKEKTDGEIEVDRLFNAFQFEIMESGFNVKIGKRVFVEYLVNIFPGIQKDRRNKNGTTLTIYKGITLKEIDMQLSPECLPVQFCKLKDFLTPLFMVTKETDHQLICDSDTCVQINGNSVQKRITLKKTKEWCLEISGKTIDLESMFINTNFQFSQESVTAVCRSVDTLNICEGVTITGSVVVSRYHTVEQFKSNEKQERKVRSIVCNRVVSINSVNRTCRKCQKMTFGRSENELGKENIKTVPVIKEIQSPQSENKSKTVTKNDILHLIPNANEEMVELLLCQVQNVGRDPKGRRWTKSVMGVCLQWYCRSPQSYEAFRESKYLVLPSPSTLVLYKNRVKHQVGFDGDVFRWMYEEAKRRAIPMEGWTGGIILDEMSIQSDIQITKTGDVVELSGLVELGDEGNLCHVMRTGKNDKTIGSHALQMVFLGISGFRFPFAHFVTDGIQAPELYTLFWEAVDRLQSFGFNAIYTCMDGAQSNRSFMKYNIGDNKTFMTPSPCSFEYMIFTMDVSHVIKKIRNNVLKSGFQKGSTRLLTLPSSHTVQWQMFLDCFLWDKTNAVQLHRKLTNEHLFPSTQSKMRNHLAEDILDNEMLNLMKMYKLYLGPKGCVLDGVIEFLNYTSKIIEIFRSKKPVQSKDDERLPELNYINKWFEAWESSAKKPQNLMSAQCNEDIHACIVGFLNLCKICLEKKDSTIFITPALINSDVVENTFNQMRSTYNGANANPNALQYRRTLNSIILGQKTVSIKANAGKSRDAAMLYECNLPTTNLKRKKPQAKHEMQPIKVIRC